jgi:hypothetical protein
MISLEAYSGLRDSLIAVLGGAAAILAAAVLVLFLRVRRLGGAVRATRIEESARQLAEHALALRQLRAEHERVARKVGDIESRLAKTIQHVGVVRYDAFREMGGKISFSAALLDDHGDGVVLTALNGRDGARAYAKGVAGGRSATPLSEEEKHALAVAAQPDGPAVERAAGV